MSDNTTTEAQQPPAQEATQTTATDPKAGETDWKAEARKWEQRAKENKSAAEELAQIRESQKSEAEKVADRIAKAEQAARDAEARALRREVALEHQLSREDAELLDDLTDEEAMRRLAQRLAAAASDVKKNGNRVPREGTTPTPKSDPKREFLRTLTGGD